ncbi:hypothetical protein LXD69_15140 [Flavobacterium sediminilitoris]|uniref:Uncharacterized protein n=1 Tax=Flavobacterium sediminilitoris TaxID=2024526 RepID=A0ABY4HNH3_9FLAO|nr:MULTISPECIES: hypothetical protein [Flavobacterium]UOX33364.1 hypothetical protein LXD69_15140 [Flavobacterium sediminilitoris]
MELTISVKQLGKKHPILQNNTISLALSSSIVTLKDLLEAVVESQVEKFKTSSFEWDDQDTIHLPKENYLPILTDTGKVGFGALYNHNIIDLQKAKETALLAYEDGLFAVFYGDDELQTLSDTIELSENKALTFIRLTFLSGSYW